MCLWSVPIIITNTLQSTSCDYHVPVCLWLFIPEEGPFAGPDQYGSKGWHRERQRRNTQTRTAVSDEENRSSTPPTTHPHLINSPRLVLSVDEVQSHSTPSSWRGTRCYTYHVSPTSQICPEQYRLCLSCRHAALLHPGTSHTQTLRSGEPMNYKPTSFSSYTSTSPYLTPYTPHLHI